MPIKIHHGPPGSYKTAGAVMDDLIPAVQAGRTIVTNVRGVSRERCLEVFPDVSESLEIIQVDTSTAEGRSQLATWFHWVPLGALLLIDEAQSVYPKRWGKADIEALDYPGGVDAAREANRPHDWATAWEMHRHYNWDVVLTTPSIKLIRSDIRETADMAYKHRNMASIGIKGFYMEAAHPADGNGARSEFLGEPKIKKIKGAVWQLYDSTATGVHAEGFGGIKIWKDPKLLLALGVLAISVLVALVTWPDDGLLPSGDKAGDSKRTASPVTAAARPLDNPGGGDAADGARVERGRARAATVSHPLHTARVVFDGEMVFGGFRSELLFRVFPQGGAPWVLTASEMRSLGYGVSRLGPCVAELTWFDWRQWVICAPPDEEERKKVIQVGLGGDS